MAATRGKTNPARLTTLTLKMTVEQRDRLRRIVESRARELLELSGQELNITASDVVRWLIDREAEARGIIEPKVASSALTEVTIPTTLPMSSTEHIPVSSSMPEVLRPLGNTPPTAPGEAIAAEPTLISDVGQVSSAPEETERRRRKPRKTKASSPRELQERIVDALSRGAFKQRELADASGVSRSLVSRFVRGGTVADDAVRRLRRGYSKLDES